LARFGRHPTFRLGLVQPVGHDVEIEPAVRDLAGNAVAGVSPRYTSSNTAALRVEPHGRIVAVGVGTATRLGG
jgi:hypothetical protein